MLNEALQVVPRVVCFPPKSKRYTYNSFSEHGTTNQPAQQAYTSF